MFGINDSTGKNTDATGPGASDSTGLSSFDHDAPAAMPPKPTPPPPLANPVTSATSGSPQDDTHVTLGVPGSDNAVSGLGDVNLENAYITSDPPSTVKPSASSKPPSASSILNTDAHEDGLLKIKQQALHSLAPLVDHLDQTAEEKFKTTMMLIQASDNAELIQDAFDAANKIEDEKIRAQALLDVVNEINYFTQQAHATSAAEEAEA